MVTEVVLTYTDNADTVVATYTNNDGKDVNVAARIKDLTSNSTIISTLSKRTTKNTAFKTALPLAKDGKSVEVSVTGLGSNGWTLNLFIPNFSYIPLESEMYSLRIKARKIQAETVINGERITFPYMTHIDRRAFYKVLQKIEE